MSFTVGLYNNTDPLNKITKSPTLVRELTGTLREETDLVDPQILIECSDTLVDVNYMRIDEFNRWYFITDITSVREGLWLVSTHCDVLYTYSEGILGHEAIISRQENSYNLYLNDSCFRAYAQPRLQIANFPNKFSGESYVLIMNGANYE